MIVKLSSLATLVCSASPVQGRQDPVSSKEEGGGGGGEENKMMKDVSTYQSAEAFELF